MNRRLLIACLFVALSGGCQFLPKATQQPAVHNPFPQLGKIAVAPFFNLSTEPTVDGRKFALAYFDELQSVPGFEVVPVGVVEKTLEAHKIGLNSPGDARKLAQILGVDAVVIGAVTDFTEYYPPRCAMQVEWYAANPNFHPIPPGYGLPWGTVDEEQIPASLIFEAEMALARAQMKTQTPDFVKEQVSDPADSEHHKTVAAPQVQPANPQAQHGKLLAHEAPASNAPAGLPPGELPPSDLPPAAQPVLTGTGLPPDWPDPRGFTPPGPLPYRPEGTVSHEPVLRHTKTYNGTNADVTEALSTMYYFRDDARFGGWQGYLQRDEDFIRFCCHMHIAEMLTARGGAGEGRVVWRWPTDRYTP